MRIAVANKKRLYRDIGRVLQQHLDIGAYRVFFFGSRVNGKGTDRSDIDIGIEGDRPVPLERIARIRAAMEDLPTLYSIDVVDFGRASADFKNVAKESIEPLFFPYEKTRRTAKTVSQGRRSA